MDDAIRPPAGEDNAATASQLAAVRAEVAALRSELHDEIRTRRLVVVEEDGFERVTLSAEGSYGHVIVAARPSAETTRTEVFAVDSEDADGPYVGVELVDRGNSVAGFSVLEGRRPRMWEDMP